MNKVFSTVAMTLAAMAVVVTTASCSDDDDMYNVQNVAEISNDMDTRSVAFTGNPEDLAENQHVGAQIVKSVAGYGDSVVFTCLTDKAPFYFVHVSERDYTAKEMDAMQYQQNDMAPDYAALENLSQATYDFVYSILGKISDYACGFGHSYEWSTANVRSFRNNFSKVYPGFPSCDFDRDEDEEEDCTVATPVFWYRNASHSYPYGHIWATVHAYMDGTNGFDADSHFCYSTTKPHRLIFYVTGHSATPEN